tara:strand:- start:1096 stop:1311 length:216 start_codon:yes stop_codon:yes gene_type:complete
MAINKPSFSTTDASEQQRLVVRMLDSRPTVLRTLQTPVTPLEIVGYYDPTFQVVELFMASAEGTFWVRIGS